MEGPIVTCVPGNSSCTASAITCDASWRMVSKTAGSSRVRISIRPSRVSARSRSSISPSSRITAAFLARDLERPSAISRPVAPSGYSRRAPSGNCSCMVLSLSNLGRRHRVIARSAEGMTTAHPGDGQRAAPPGSVPDQRLLRIGRTGRQIAALAPDQRRKRQLIGADRAPDAAFVGGHAVTGPNEIEVALMAGSETRSTRDGGDSSCALSFRGCPHSLQRRFEREQRRSVAGGIVFHRLEHR